MSVKPGQVGQATSSRPTTSHRVAKVARPDASLVRTSVSPNSRQRKGSTKRVGTDGTDVTCPKGAPVNSGPGVSRSSVKPGEQSEGNLQLVAVLSKHGEPLMPCHPARARELLRDGKATVVRRNHPCVIKLKNRISGEVQPVSCKIDPGASHTGMAIARLKETSAVVALGLFEFKHHGPSIKKALKQRAGYRRRRRSANLRYRAKRFSFRGHRKNHRDGSGWLAPSIQHLVDSTTIWVRKLMRWYPVNLIVPEENKFDTQLMENPYISGVEYQRGTLFGHEVRIYVFERDKYTCAYCGAKNVPFELDHVIARAHHGTDRISNLVTSCVPCNRRKANQKIEDFLSDKPEVLKRVQSQLKTSLRGAAAVNSSRPKLMLALGRLGIPLERGSTGGMTKYNRERFTVPKTHALDALCVGKVNGVSGFQKLRTTYITCKGRGSYQRAKVNNSGFAVGRTKDSIGQHNPRRKRIPDCRTGFATGDFVRAVSRRGWIEGRIKTVRSKGNFDILDVKSGEVRSASPKNCHLLSRSDGYSYR